MDSRFPPGKPVVSEKQEEIAASFDRWYHTLFAFGGVSQYQSPIHAETDMKYLTIKICISVCRFQDESAYDSFSEFFKRIVQAATWILENCSKRTSESTERRFDFETSYLPLLEFVIVKCRWLEIRYQALDIVWKLATGSREPVACGNLYSVGMRMIKEEHNVKNENVASTTADLPSEEIRVREYRTDPRFLELVTVPIVDTERPAEVEVPYTQRLLLWCGSPELAILVRKLERRRCSQQESFISKAVVGSF
ncbi:C6 zinc finger domain protein [Colletotrichum tofieldiae]|nr:C6 zinc finger domain protein [Colletotrichum tofieldiae]GKT68893.1 C6 zinc finger domain protein [Colletotrichum tofieldiae]